MSTVRAERAVLERTAATEPDLAAAIHRGPTEDTPIILDRRPVRGHRAVWDRVTLRIPADAGYSLWTPDRLIAYGLIDEGELFINDGSFTLVLPSPMATFPDGTVIL